jgi:hypothetical protein
LKDEAQYIPAPQTALSFFAIATIDGVNERPVEHARTAASSRLGGEVNHTAQHPLLRLGSGKSDRQRLPRWKKPCWPAIRKTQAARNS